MADRARDRVGAAAKLFRRTSAGVAILSALLLSEPSGMAQRSARSLSGTVRDRHHEPLRGAVIQVEDETTNSVTSYITDRAGHYAFKRLNTEIDYRVTAAYRGRHSSAKELSHFDTNKTKVMDLVIKNDKE